MPESITSPDTGLATVSPGPDPASTNRPQPCRTPGPVDPVRPALLRHRLGPVGRLDIIASADGRLIPASRLKIVQPAEAGVIREILASEGQRVRAGQLLMCMDSLEADTDLQSLQQDRERTRLALARVQAELDGSPFQPAQAAPADLAREVLARYRADQQALHGQLAEAQARHLKARRELAAAQQQKQAIEAVLPYYRKQATSIGRLAKQGLSAQSTADEKERQRLEKEAALATQQRLIESAQASIALSEKKIERLRADHILTLRRELDQTGKHLAQLGYRIRKQRHRQAQLSLRAPHDGVIKQLATHAMGTVVQPGQPVLGQPGSPTPSADIWDSKGNEGASERNDALFRTERGGVEEDAATANKTIKEIAREEAALAQPSNAGVISESAQASIALEESAKKRSNASAQTSILTLRRELDQTGKHQAGAFAQLGYRIRKQRHRQAQLSLRAPHDGVIKQLATHAMGTVVQPGTVLATVAR